MIQTHPAIGGKILDQNSINKKCLIIKGARQVGKTYLVRAFGEAEYESFIEINFFRQPELKQIFSGGLSGDEIYKKITASIPGIKMIPGKTLIFLDEIQSRLISDYEDDIAQHAKGVEKTKVRRCYDSIPNQLARENKKFKYSEVEKKSTAKKYGDSIQWLIDANMAFSCKNLCTPSLPLRYNEKENEFKLYINDTGLLMALFGFNTKLAVLNNTLIGFAKGGIYENFVAEALIKKGYTLHYFKPDNESELEFVIEKNGEVVPIEVKAGNTATKSLNRYIEKYNPSIAYKIMSGNIGEVEKKLSLPHYMVMFL